MGAANGGAPKPGAERLQRVLADLGVASRRKCEALIEEGHVRVNGETVQTLPAFVSITDKVEVDGVVVQRGRGAPRPRGTTDSPDAPRLSRKEQREADRPDPPTRLLYIALYKPRGVVTSASDPAGRRTVLDLVKHPSGARLFPVGRLDYETQGLLLLTNDGELANRLTHPRYGVHKTYRALVKGSLDDAAVRALEDGIYLAERKEGKTVGAARTARVKIEIVKRDRDRTVLDIALQEGRNRQVRRMLAKAGCQVKRLVRTRIGPLALRGLAVGQWRELTRDELRTLRAAAAGELPGALAGATGEALTATPDHAPVSRRNVARAAGKRPVSTGRRTRPASDGREGARPRRPRNPRNPGNPRNPRSPGKPGGGRGGSTRRR